MIKMILNKNAESYLRLFSSVFSKIQRRDYQYKSKIINELLEKEEVNNFDIVHALMRSSHGISIETFDKAFSEVQNFYNEIPNILKQLDSSHEVIEFLEDKRDEYTRRMMTHGFNPRRFCKYVIVDSLLNGSGIEDLSQLEKEAYKSYLEISEEDISFDEFRIGFLQAITVVALYNLGDFFFRSIRLFFMVK